MFRCVTFTWYFQQFRRHVTDNALHDRQREPIQSRRYRGRSIEEGELERGVVRVFAGGDALFAGGRFLLCRIFSRRFLRQHDGGQTRFPDGIFFQIDQNFLGAGDYFHRQTGKFRHVDPVTLVGGTRHDLAQEHDLIAVLPDRHIVVIDAPAGQRQFRQLVIMGGELGAADGVVQQIFRHRPRNGKAVKGAGAASDLVQDHDAFFRGVVEDTIALPPHIAVPELIKYEVSRSTFNSFRPISQPISMVPTTETIVKAIPSLPD